jgi:tetratricopeptide (TPR) repeat protein
MFKWISIPVLAVVLLGIAVWYLARPGGNLRIAREKDQKEEAAKEFNDIFYAAHQKIRTITQLHNTLGLGLRVITGDPVPALPGPNSWILSDLIKIKESSFNFDARAIKFEGQFNGDNIMNAAYAWVGWHDDYLVVRNYPTCASQQPGTECADVTIWPIDVYGVRLTGTRPEIKGNLAVYLFKAFLKQEVVEKRIDPKTVLPLDELSSDFQSLETSAHGLEILEQGLYHSSCMASDLSACRSSAHRFFEDALKRDPNNAYGRLGMGLLVLRDALDAARSGDRVFNVLKMLDDAARHLGAARLNSSALSDFLSDPKNIASFKLVGLDSFRITPSFIASIPEYALAYRAYGDADYEMQLTYSNQVTDIPEELKTYLNGMEYEARLDLAKSAQEARPLLDDLEKIAIRANLDEAWMYSIVYASQACRFGLKEVASDAMIERALDSAGRNTALHFDTLVWKAYCRAYQGKREGAENLIREVTAFVQANDATQKIPWREIETIYIDLGYYFASEPVRNYVAVASNFLKVLSEDPCFWRRVTNDEQLRSFRKDEAFHKLRDNYATNAAAQSGCRR